VNYSRMHVALRTVQCKHKEGRRMEGKEAYSFQGQGAVARR